LSISRRRPRRPSALPSPQKKPPPGTRTAVVNL
jgi:hypothetical protein